MKISRNWVKEYTKVDLPLDELVKKIGAQLGEVDSVTNLGVKYAGIVVATVISCEKHPNADKLHVCMIDDGGAASDVERDENGHVRVVCGAPNVRAGLSVAWLPPGATVPSTFDKDPFVLGSRELRGVISNGMLASPQELAMGDSHDGILEIDSDAKPGTPLADVYQLNDYIIDVENKMFTHRPDCFGMLGLAREIAGIQHQPFSSPDWYTQALELTPATNTLPLTVRNEVGELVPRFMAVTMSNIDVKPSPVQMQSYLSRVGIKPINNIVDITNYVMYLTAQPLHAYDYDKVMALDGGRAATLVARHPKDGEKLALLNGKEITPRPDGIMIATDSQLIGVAGVMGGTETEVDAQTKNIILEVATFDMYSIRRTSMAHGLFTEAVTRFNKGQSSLQNDKVLAYAGRMIADLTQAGEFAGAVQDVHDGALAQPEPITLSAGFINDRLGLQLSDDDITKLLQAVEFTVQTADDQLHIVPPFWRTDITYPEDLVEEVGRLYGYDHLPQELPGRSVAPVAKDTLLTFKSHVRQVLSRLGANELLTYSFVHGDLMAKAGQDTSQAYELSNALSPDLQYFRTSLTPSLLDKVHANIRAGYGQFGLFEMNKVHSKALPLMDGVPEESYRLALVYAADTKAAQHYAGAPFYQAKQYLTALLHDLGITSVQYKPLPAPSSETDMLTLWLAPFEPNRSAVVVVDIPHGPTQTIIGVVGEYKSSIKKTLKLPDFTAGFECDLHLLRQLHHAVGRSTYQPLPKFPKTEQDISFKLPVTVAHAQLEHLIDTQLAAATKDHGYRVLDHTTVDIYQSPEAPEHKHATLRITLTHPNRTLTTDEVNTLLDTIAAAAQQELQAVRL